ncbi:hypothetical protein RND81_03G100400 [Saponaria officinalis]
MGSGKHRWKISIYRKHSDTVSPLSDPRNVSEAKPPAEFVCPISGSVMADPVIVATGQTFERACVTACKTIGFTPTLCDGSIPDFSVIIPNLALKTSILNWAKAQLAGPPSPVQLSDALKLVTSAMTMMTSTTSPPSSGESELTRSRGGFDSDESGESELTRAKAELSSGSFRRTPLMLATRPSCYSSCSSSSELETGESGTCDDEGYVWKMRSPHVYEQEEVVAALRKVTKSSVESRVNLCTARLLSALRSLITSKYTDIQV